MQHQGFSAVPGQQELPLGRRTSAVVTRAPLPMSTHAHRTKAKRSARRTTRWAANGPPRRRNASLDEAELRELGTRRASAETSNVPITAWMIPTAQSDAPPSSAAVQRMTMAASTFRASSHRPPPVRRAVCQLVARQQRGNADAECRRAEHAGEKYPRRGRRRCRAHPSPCLWRASPLRRTAPRTHPTRSSTVAASSAPGRSQYYCELSTFVQVWSGAKASILAASLAVFGPRSFWNTVPS